MLSIFPKWKTESEILYRPVFDFIDEYRGVKFGRCRDG